MHFILYLSLIILYLFLFIKYLFRSRQTVYFNYYSETDFPIQLYFNSTILPFSLSLRQCLNAVAQAARTYNIQLKYKIFDSNVKINTGNFVLNNKSIIIPIRFKWVDGLGKIQALAYLPPYRGINVDVGDTWNIHKLKSILLHELGHSLGMLHAPYHVDSVMVSGRLYDELQSRDIIKLKEIYPFFA